MAYQTYITEALVCGSRDSNTYDKSYLLFTREGGMVFASARSVRKEKSKQRYALQDFSHVRVSLVSGKGGWRIAGVESFENMYFIANGREARKLVRNTTSLIRRIIQGESPHQEVFDDVMSSLHECNDVNQNKLELVLSLRVLNFLGYVPARSEYSYLLESQNAYDEIDKMDDKQISLCESTVQSALLNSQL